MLENKKRPLEPDFYDPHKNPKMISLWEDADGNWKGLAQRHGKVVESREAKPEDALVKILTHD